MPSSISSLPSCTDPALRIEALTGPVRQPLVHDVSLRVPCGCTTVVLGPSHSGKSSILRHVLGLERATQGRVSIGDDGFDVAAPEPDSLRRIRSRLGTVFESSALLQRISVVENVELPILEHTSVKPAKARERARELLFEVGLRVEEEMPEDLTRAEQRRVALARALALRPAVLILDEPSMGLDSPAAHDLDETVHTLQDRYGFGVLILTREVRYAFGDVDEIDVLVHGRIVARGDRESVLESEHPVVRQLLHRRGERGGGKRGAGAEVVAQRERSSAGERSERDGEGTR